MQKDANLVELEKCCQTHIFLHNFVLIQPRTSPPKNYKILQNFEAAILLAGVIYDGRLFVGYNKGPEVLQPGLVLRRPLLLRPLGHLAVVAVRRGWPRGRTVLPVCLTRGERGQGGGGERLQILQKSAN